jgi:hypothetical protein
LINISILSKSLPRLSILWTNGFDLYPDENLAKLVTEIVICFEQMVELTINKGSHCRHHGIQGFQILRTQQKTIENFLRNTIKLCDPNRTHIFWTCYSELQIWL